MIIVIIPWDCFRNTREPIVIRLNADNSALQLKDGARVVGGVVGRLVRVLSQPARLCSCTVRDYRHPDRQKYSVVSTVLSMKTFTILLHMLRFHECLARELKGLSYRGLVVLPIKIFLGIATG